MADSNMDAIDLYADVDDFGREQTENFHESDLYDDVITSRHDTLEEPTKPSTQVAPVLNSGGSGKKYALYVGNLTWWTTDQDLQDAMGSIGISDLINIKFHENRTNGQSKGFATVVVGSESSSRLLLERLIQKDLHGMLPSVSYCTKTALERLDPASKKEQSLPPGNAMGQRSTGSTQRGSNDSKMYSSSSPLHAPRHLGPPPSVPLGHPHHGSMTTNGLHQPMYSGVQPPPHTQLPPPPGHPPPPNVVHMVPRDGGPPPQVLSAPPPRTGPLGPPPQSVIIVDPRLPPPRSAWARPPPEFAPMHPGGQPVNLYGPPPSLSVPPPGDRFSTTLVQSAPGPPTQIQLISGGIPGHQLPPSAAHINPAFLPPPASAIPQSIASSFPPDPYGRPPPSAVYTTPLDAGHRPMSMMDRDRDRVIADPYMRRPSPDRRDRDPPPTTPLLSDTEFDEILQRNKTVSSGAISRAVQDASSGDYGSAIETLVTAVSLIKQSKIANDDRCKILISSLQDTLHGIELKSYGSKSTSRRSRSPRDRDIDRSRSRQQRSRSREFYDRVGGGRDSRTRERSREPAVYRGERSRSREPYDRSSDSLGRGGVESRRYESASDSRHRDYSSSNNRSSRH